MTTQSIAEDLSAALEKAEASKEAEIALLEFLERTDAFKKYTIAKQEAEIAKSESDTVKATLLEDMKENDEKSISAGGYRMHTSEKENVTVMDDEKMEKWLKKNKKYDDVFKMEPKLDKKGLNKYILDLRNDRQMPDVEDCGIEIVPNIFITVNKIDDEQ